LAPGVNFINFLCENCASCYSQVAISCAKKRALKSFSAQTMDKLKLTSTIFVRNFHRKKHGEISFQDQAAFFVFCAKKSVFKHVDEIVTCTLSIL
jgi:hypothetical protein